MSAFSFACVTGEKIVLSKILESKNNAFGITLEMHQKSMLPAALVGIREKKGREGQVKRRHQQVAEAQTLGCDPFPGLPSHR